MEKDKASTPNKGKDIHVGSDSDFEMESDSDIEMATETTCRLEKDNFSSRTSNMENDIEQGSALDIEKAKDILKTLNTEVRQNGSESHGSECCIYRVPNQLRNVNSKAYDPNLISIGPLHRENKGLEAMEKEKLNSFRKLTEQYGMDEKEMCDIVISIKNQEERLRNCYSEKSRLMESSDDFVKMIILDAVFIILFFLESNDDSGPKILEPWMTSDLREDLMLLENQLPLFIIQEIYDRVSYRSQDAEAIHFLDIASCHFRKESFLKRVETRHFTALLGSRHFTDLLRNLMLGGANEQSEQSDFMRSDKVMLGGANEQSDFMWSDKVTLGFEQSEHSCQTGDSASTEFSAKLKTRFTDLLRKLMLCRAIEQSDSSSGVDGKTAALVLSTRVLKYSAVMLLKAGVRFQVTRGSCLVDITFDKGS